MSLAIKYENVEDAKMRLRQTVVLYKDEPVYITDIIRGEGKDDVLRVLFTDLPTDTLEVRNPFRNDPKVRDDPGPKPERKYISSKYFDIAPFRMGYVNDKKGAFYCSRMPGRNQKQGLSGDNFKGRDNFGRVVGWAEFLACKNIKEMVGNIYPTFEQAVKALDKSPAVAFHRDFCLVKDEVVPALIWLYYKGNKVGMINKGETTLGPKFNCLKESLQEMHLKVGVY